MAHAKAVSVGNAAALFGAGDGDDFFASRAPSIAQISEDDELAAEADLDGVAPPGESPTNLFGHAQADDDWLAGSRVSAAADGPMPAYAYAPAAVDAEHVNGEHTDAGLYLADRRPPEVPTYGGPEPGLEPAPYEVHDPALESPLGSTRGSHAVLDEASVAATDRHAWSSTYADHVAPATYDAPRTSYEPVADPPSRQPAGGYSPPPGKKRTLLGATPAGHRKSFATAHVDDVQQLAHTIASPVNVRPASVAPPPVSFFAELPAPRRSASAMAHVARFGVPSPASPPPAPSAQSPPPPPPPAAATSAWLASPPLALQEGYEPNHSHRPPSRSRLTAPSPAPRIGVSPPSPQTSPMASSFARPQPGAHSDHGASHVASAAIAPPAPESAPPRDAGAGVFDVLPRLEDEHDRVAHAWASVGTVRPSTADSAGPYSSEDAPTPACISQTADEVAAAAALPGLSYSDYRRQTHGSISSHRSDEESAGGSGYGRPRSPSISSHGSLGDLAAVASSGDPYAPADPIAYASSQVDVPSWVHGSSLAHHTLASAQMDPAGSYGDPAGGYGERTPSQALSDPYNPRTQLAGAPQWSPSPTGEPYGIEGALTAQPLGQSGIEHELRHDGYPHPARPPSRHEPASDVLRRDRQTAPIVRFGSAGRLVVLLPAANFSTLSAASPRVQIRRTFEHAPLSEPFPGPLYHDGGWNKAVQIKKRKEAVTWLEACIAGRQRALAFESSTGAAGGTPDERRWLDQDRLALFQLVRLLLDGDGRLGGTTTADADLVRALLPDAPIDDSLPTAADLGAAATAARGGRVISASDVRDSDLDELQRFLLRGDRRAAMRAALDRRLWGHAMVLAAAVDQDAWREAVAELVRSDLLPGSDDGHGADESNGREALRVAYGLFAGLQGAAVYDFAPAPVATQLRAQLATALPTEPAALPVNGRSLTPGPHPALSRAGTPQSAPPTLTAKLTGGTLSRWRETAATIVANRVPGEAAALNALGSTLLANDRVDAAHCCFLLASPGGALGGVVAQWHSPPRIGVLGIADAQQGPGGPLDNEGIALSEIAELALSLAPVAKGQDAFAGLPYLQAFRLLHAMQLADLGDPARAQRYCEAIGSTIKAATRMSPCYSPALVEQVRHLSERLVGLPQGGKASWISGLQRPKLDTLWTTLEDRVSKFVAGENERSLSTGPGRVDSRPGTAVPANRHSGIGPFSHYSSISPASTNGQVSRATSQTDLHAAAAPFLPVGEPAAFASNVTHADGASAPPPPLHAASSRARAAAPTAPAAATSRHSHKKSMSLGYLAYGSDPYAAATGLRRGPPGHAPDDLPDANTPRARPHSFDQAERPALSSLTEDAYDHASRDGAGLDDGGGGGWWDAAGRGDAGQYAGTVPPTFGAPVDDAVAGDGADFLSPMALAAHADSPSYVPEAAAPWSQAGVHEGAAPWRGDDDDVDGDELGLGNSRPRAARSPLADSAASHTSAASAQTEPGAEGDAGRPSMRSSASTWSLGRWFRRELASPAPGSIKANMGEESSFVYDPDLKRWVNKKAGAPETTAPVPAPPPRAQTTSPVATREALAPARFMSASPPPPRPHSAAPVDGSAEAGRIAGGDARVGPSASPLVGPPAPPLASKGRTAPVKGRGGRRYVDVM